MKRILVPVDGSENSVKALNKAKEIGLLNNSEILILTVVNSQRDNPYIIEQDYTSELSKKNIEKGKKVLEASLDVIGDYPGNVETMLRNGDVAETIIDIAEDENYDLIVMGRRGANISSRSLLGSVSNKVLNYAPKSVMVVK
ncbi:universal stress protein [Gudongella sp. DL1XJH-153]|uniref:universal stress protein n=1 Tax=Gudongella sp. DL1XJH-153 TaxID=3409804 RepID=UPI003BB73BCC